jgi:TRAP-type C4-dicarboxylate transport system permease small subunit
MNSEETPRVNQRISFLKDTLTYLENRIRLVDNKASILTLIATALFALFAWAKGLDRMELLPNITSFDISSSFVLEILVFSLTICTLLLLIQVVRPTKEFSLV